MVGSPGMSVGLMSGIPNENLPFPSKEKEIQVQFLEAVLIIPWEKSGLRSKAKKIFLI